MKMATDTLLLIDKPYGWTSFQVVEQVRNRLKIGKVGHAGTLDPLATGLLLLCTGKKTKTIPQYQGMPKVYEVVIELGKRTPSFDLEQSPIAGNDYADLTPTIIQEALKKFTGTIAQVPPLYSALKRQDNR